jgi:hypothetical protein
MDDLDLAASLVDSFRMDFWKSAAQGEIALAHARQGRTDRALAAADAMADPYLATLTLGKLAAAFGRAQQRKPMAAAIERLRSASAKVTDDIARDYGLRLVVRALAEAGQEAEATRLATLIRDPAWRVLAGCEVVTSTSVAGLSAAIAQCAAEERPVLWEALTVACARRNLAVVRDLSLHLESGWARFRTQCAAAEALLTGGHPQEAGALLAAAEQTAAALDDPQRRFAAHLRLAAMAGSDPEAGDRVDRHLAAAMALLPADAAADARFAGGIEISFYDAKTALTALFVETMIQVGRFEQARRFIATLLADNPPPGLRDRLVPLLAMSGGADAAVAAVEKQQLMYPDARRALVYRLAEAGALDQALVCARRLRSDEQAAALCDIALSQVPTPAVEPRAERSVGVSLHGYLCRWFPTLERMGVDWEPMPFTAPYESTPAQLASRYLAVGFGGTDGHEPQLGVPGVERLRDYVRGGGNLFGICAGMHLVTQGGRFGAYGVYRGVRPTYERRDIAIVPGHPISFGLPPVINIRRAGGGMIFPRGGSEVVGWYDASAAYAALAAEEYGSGRVAVFSPHPEGSPAFEPGDLLFANALSWMTTGLP